MDSILTSNRARWLAFSLCATLALSACGGDEDESVAAAPTPAPSPSPSAGGSSPPSNSNAAPTIAGAPPLSTLYGRRYEFRPTASDPNGDILTFTVTGRPSWASFDPATGRLSGTPTQADIGSTANVRISVTDGAATTNLPAFNLQVVATATGSATLSWTPPTSNSDGSPLTNLASYRVYFGTNSGSYPNSMTVNGTGVATFVVDQLTPATWYFVITAVNASGVESVFSNVASKAVL